VRRLLGPCAAVIVAAACTRGGLPPEQVQAWVGRPATDLTRAWGAPTREVTDQGLRVLIYEELERASGSTFSSQRISPREARAAGVPAEPPSPIVYARSYLFWVDAAGTIVRSQIRQP
jgi:hypothetical protein